MAARYQPGDPVYYEGEPEKGMVVWVDEPIPNVYHYKVLWNPYEKDICDALYGAWYSEACLDDEPRPMDESLF